MKILTFKRLSLVLGLALGIMTIWSSASPGDVDDIALRGAGWCYENCTEAGTCSGTYDGCESGYLAKCHTGSEDDEMCKYTGSKGGTCEGSTACDRNSNAVREETCYTP
jgi:hypothetical protein